MDSSSISELNSLRTRCEQSVVAAESQPFNISIQSTARTNLRAYSHLLLQLSVSTQQHQQLLSHQHHCSLLTQRLRKLSLLTTASPSSTNSVSSPTSTNTNTIQSLLRTRELLAKEVIRSDSTSASIFSSSNQLTRINNLHSNIGDSVSKSKHKLNTVYLREYLHFIYILLALLLFFGVSLFVFTQRIQNTKSLQFSKFLFNSIFRTNPQQHSPTHITTNQSFIPNPQLLDNPKLNPFTHPIYSNTSYCIALYASHALPAA
mmetsp:Transcript_10656/g.19224  ORF Transcript_10656/g.19224 Transcript_10656/m.19224 type:complete len:261 (-) Transcript_10656:493-1275(-)